MRRFGIAAIALVAAGAAGWYFFLRSDGEAIEAGFTLETANVDRGDVAKLVSASGAVRALTTVEVGSQLSGQVLELNADFNTEVKAGQIIARIDPQTFQNRVEAARADVISAEASLAVQRSQIERAQANLKNAELDYERTKALFAEDAIARSVLEDTERALNVAQADLAVSQSQLRTAQASLTQRRASLRSAEVDLERTIIRSPIDGVVIERNVDVGQTVAASFNAPVLFRVAQDLSDIRIDAAVVEADIGSITPGDPATFQVDAYPDETFEGVVEQVRLSPTTLQNVVTYTVVIAAQNPRGKLLPGMTANVEITADKRENVLRLPASTLRFRPPENTVTVLSASGEEQETGRRGGPGGGGGFPTSMERMAEIGITISQEQSDRMDAKFRELFMSMRAQSEQPGAQFNRARMREVMQARSERIMKDELTPEQFAVYQEVVNARANRRPVELFKFVDGQTVQTHRVIVGLSDGEFTEILEGAEEGDTFVARLNQAAGAQ